MSVTTTERLATFVLVGATVAGSVGPESRAVAAASAVGLVRFAPPASPAATRGLAAAGRFGLARRYELTWQVANAFSDENRAATARVEASIGALPGARQALGPARLLALSVDSTGHASATPLAAVEGPVAAGPLTGRTGAAGRATLFEERLLRRGDALGWFIPPDGLEIRLLVDADDLPHLEAPIAAAVASSRLAALSASAPGRPLWPEPEHDPLPFARTRPAELAIFTALPLLVVVLAARPSGRRFATGVSALAVAIAVPGLAAPSVPIQHYALLTGAAAAGVSAAAWGAVALRRKLHAWHGRSPGALAARTLAARASTSLTSASLLSAPLALVGPSLALVAAAVALSPRLELRSELGSETSLFFVDVRADLAEPVVLREIRRLTDRLAETPGIAGAWSIADLFSAVSRSDGAADIPATRAEVRAILDRASADPAVLLEVAPDLDEALIAVRFDEDGGFDPAQVLDRAAGIARRQLRPWLWRVDVNDARLPLATRALGRGVLAEDALERILDICARAGHSLDDEQRLAIGRSLRRVSLAPKVDAARFRADVAGEVAAFLEEVALSEHRVAPPHPIQRQKLVDAVLALPGDPGAAELSAALVDLWGPRAAPSVRQARGEELRRRLVRLRRRAVTGLAAKSILADAGLPTEGALSEQVQDATLEAMGPVVGVPAAPGAQGALHLDTAIVGGPACDRALSAAWAPRLRLGILVVALLNALLLIGRGGARGLAWWPPTLAPAALVSLVPAIAGIPMGSLFVAVLAGALGGGALFGVSLAGAGRGRRP